MLYRCKRTASIISRNYITTATLSRPKFNELLIEQPELKKSLLKHLYTYRYDRKSYIRSIFNSVDYLRDLTREQFHKIYYSLKQITIESGTRLLRRHEKIQSFYIVEHGELEAFIDLDGNLFMLERFPMGTVINSRTLITEDQMILQIRANKTTHLLEFTSDLL